MTGTPLLGNVSPGEVQVAEIADHIFAYVQAPGGWCVSNAGLLIGSEGPAVVDTAATRQRAHRLRMALAELTPLPPHVLINTHFHGDHTFGNSVVADARTVIVAHELARQEMITAGLGLTRLWPDTNWGAVDIRLPELTFRDRVTLRLGDHLAELIFVGPAHTITDVVVWLPGERVLFAGDVVMPGCTPFLLMGSVAGSLRALAALRALDPRVVVGGHGPVSGREVLGETEGYLRWLQQTARETMAAGLTPLEAARAAGSGDYAAWLDPERLVGNLHRAYSELRGEPDGEELDVVGIFGEMVAYNGGRPPACYA